MNVGTTASKDHVELVFLPTLLARIGAAAANVSVWAHTFRDYGDEALANGALDLVAVPPRVEIAPFQLVAAWHERDARDAPQRCFREQLFAVAAEPQREGVAASSCVARLVR